MQCKSPYSENGMSRFSTGKLLHVPKLVHLKQLLCAGQARTAPTDCGFASRQEAWPCWGHHDGVPCIHVGGPIT